MSEGVAMLQISEDKKRYIVESVNPILEEMVAECILKAPKDPVPWMLEYLEQAKIVRDEKDLTEAEKERLEAENKQLMEDVEKARSTMHGCTNMAQVDALAAGAGTKQEEEEEEEDDMDDEPPADWEKPQGKSARASVSAEAYGEWNTKKAFVAPVIQKTEEQKERLKTVLKSSFLFASLDDVDFSIIISAMKEVQVKEKERVITQGDTGSFLFVIESGDFNCLIKDDEGEEKNVKTCKPGDVFGELALLYNCPRAASVESAGDSVCWQLDRDTFSHIVKEAAQKKRNRYDAFLQKVPLLSSMEPYERTNLADALLLESFADGATIVNQGEVGKKFYIVEDGCCHAKKDGVQVMEYSPGDYFGELALIRNQPRAATVTAKGPVKILSLDSGSFSRLLNVNDLLERSTKAYQ